MKLPRNLDDLVATGRSSLEGLAVEGGRSARRLYADGRHWIEDHLSDASDARRGAQRGGERVRKGVAWAEDKATDRARAAVRVAADERLRAPVRWIEARLPEPRRASSVLWPSVLAAAGAGVAFWWWTSWSRGRAEAAERAALDAAGGAEGRANPEQVMAHAPAPAEMDPEAPDASAARLSVPAEEVLSHASPPQASESADETARPSRRKRAAKAASIDTAVAAQGVAAAPPTTQANGARPPGGADA